ARRARGDDGQGGEEEGDGAAHEATASVPCGRSALDAWCGVGAPRCAGARCRNRALVLVAQHSTGLADDEAGPRGKCFPKVWTASPFCGAAPHSAERLPIVRSASPFC